MHNTEHWLRKEKQAFKLRWADTTCQETNRRKKQRTSLTRLSGPLARCTPLAVWCSIAQPRVGSKDEQAKNSRWRQQHQRQHNHPHERANSKALKANNKIIVQHHITGAIGPCASFIVQPMASHSRENREDVSAIAPIVHRSWESPERRSDRETFNRCALLLRNQTQRTFANDPTDPAMEFNNCTQLLLLKAFNAKEAARDSWDGTRCPFSFASESPAANFKGG